MKTVVSGVFKEIVDKINEAVFLIDSDGKVIFANRAACKLTGKSFQDLSGGNVFDEFELGAGEVDSGDEVWVRAGKGESSTLLLWVKATGRACEARLLPLDEAYEQKAEYCLIVEEVSEKVQLSKRLVDSLSPEVAVLLVSDFVHDMKNIILGVSGYAAMAMETLPDDHPVYQDLKDIAGSMEELGSIIERYSKVGRTVAKRKDDVRIREVVTQVVHRLRRIAGPGVRLDVKFGTDEDLCARVSRRSFEDVLMKILLNSYNAVEGSGVIRIEVDSCRAKDAVAPFADGELDKMYCCIRITDYGQGMDVGNIDKVFEPFYTTKAGTKHIGLGLTVAQSVLRSMEGHIKIEPLKGGGTEVTLLIPQKS